MKESLICLVLLSCLASCDNQRVYEVNSEFEHALWLADSAKSFNFSIQDTTESYNLYCNLRNTASYPFQNIYIDYVLSDTTGSQLEGELVNQDLFDPVSGKPYGDGFGDVSDHQFALLKKYKFPQKGNYSVTLKQYMRRDTLPDVIAVGIRIEKTME